MCYYLDSAKSCYFHVIHFKYRAGNLKECHPSSQLKKWKVWPECSLPWSEGCGQSLPPPKASFWEGSRCGVRLYINVYYCLIYVCAIWIKMTNIPILNTIWTLMSLFPILSPQSRSFIPLYEGVWDVADHRVKELRVVLLKLSSNLNDCENDCGMGTMTKKVGFWFKSNSKYH